MYKAVFGAELRMMTFGEAGNADFVGEENAHKIMHAGLRTAAVAGDDAFDERDGIFTKLAEGGEVVVPLSQQSWGAAYG